RTHVDTGVPWHERDHGVLQRAIAHLSMYHADARFGDDLTEAPGDVVDVLDPVVDEEHLAATAQLTEHGVADDALVVARDVGTDGEPIDGWRLDDAQVADAGEGHVEGARDRRGGERQDVHAAAQRADALLVLHAEAVLLVDDEQAQLAELDVLLQQAVGADDDVEPSVLEAHQRLAVL